MKKILKIVNLKTWLSSILPSRGSSVHHKRMRLSYKYKSFNFGTEEMPEIGGMLMISYLPTSSLAEEKSLKVFIDKIEKKGDVTVIHEDENDMSDITSNDPDIWNA